MVEYMVPEYSVVFNLLYLLVKGKEVAIVTTEARDVNPGRMCRNQRPESMET